MGKKLALYLHLPFCRRKCLYCDFISFAGLETLIPDYVKAVAGELRQAFAPQGRAFGRRVATVFFGGGTPSLLSGKEVNFLLEKAGEFAAFLPKTEITLEANPGTVFREKLEELKAAGVNRLSFGTQCGEDRLLQVLGRVHTVREAEESYELARKVGFTNINLDLIFGLPGQNKEDWVKTLKWAVSLNPEHLTCYGLQVEEGTPLAAEIRQGRLLLPPEEEAEAMYEYTMEYLSIQGYRQYETVSFARKGFECRHNLYYWTSRDYLGVGAGAYSTVDERRWANLEQPQEYIKEIALGRQVIKAEEDVGEKQKMVEMIMLGLRLEKGPNPQRFYRRWGRSLQTVLCQQAGSLIKNGFLKFNNGTYTLTRQGKLVSNRVLQELLLPLL